MSALGHKQTNHRGPKSTFVRYCPKADKRREIERPPRGNLFEKSVSCFDQAAACGLSPADPILNLPHKFNSAALCVLLLPGRRRHQARNQSHHTLGIAVHRPCLFQ
jgi:hypothetical protein